MQNRIKLKDVFISGLIYILAVILTIVGLAFIDINGTSEISLTKLVMLLQIVPMIPVLGYIKWRRNINIFRLRTDEKDKVKLTNYILPTIGLIAATRIVMTPIISESTNVISSDNYEVFYELSRVFLEEPAFMIMFMVSAVTWAIIIEEIWFRGIILEGIKNRFGIVSALILSSLAFAIMHGNLVQGVNTFFIGLICGWLYIETNSLWMAIFAHFINNVSAFIDIEWILNLPIILQIVIYGGAIVLAGVMIKKVIDLRLEKGESNQVKGNSYTFNDSYSNMENQGEYSFGGQDSYGYNNTFDYGTRETDKYDSRYDLNGHANDYYGNNVETNSQQNNSDSRYREEEIKKSDKKFKWIMGISMSLAGVGAFILSGILALMMMLVNSNPELVEQIIENPDFIYDMTDEEFEEWIEDLINGMFTDDTSVAPESGIEEVLPEDNWWEYDSELEDDWWEYESDFSLPYYDLDDIWDMDFLNGEIVYSINGETYYDIDEYLKALDKYVEEVTEEILRDIDQLYDSSYIEKVLEDVNINYNSGSLLEKIK